VGTTTTAFPVSFKLTGVGPVFISLGALLSGIGPRSWRPAGKALFFFGLVLFTLDLISEALAPVRSDPRISGLLALAGDPWVGVLAGAAITAIVQSSSVTTGLCVVLAQQGVLGAEAAIYVVVGANVGTTITALVAGSGMGTLARRTAVINTGFNVLGALLFAPVLVIFAAAVVKAAGTPDMAVALAHLLFNAVTAGLLLVIMPLYAGRLEAWAMRGVQPPQATPAD
jgi:Na/Pi-cotransporter